MTEWEQIKKEYREIPIPADGPRQMLESIADAKRKRDRWKHVVKYGSIVAAAMLVVLILPGILLFSGGFGGSNDMAAPESAVKNEESTGSNGWFAKDSAENATDNDNMAPPPEAMYDDKTNSGGSSMSTNQEVMTEAGSPDYGMNKSDSALDECTTAIPTPAAGQADTPQKAESVQATQEAMLGNEEAISAEILRQMEERMQKNDEAYYIRSEEYPNGFEIISKEQEYYVNEDGLFVIVFEAGMVAPEAMGVIEFIIPAEVAAP